MVERIKFAGDPTPGESGSGQAPQIPLNMTVPPVSVEMLDKKGEGKAQENIAFNKKAPKQQVVDDEDDDEEDDDLVEGPDYDRERIGARIGEGGPEATKDIEKVEEQLDTEEVVPCLFPKAVKVQDKGLMHTFAAGVHLVPVSLAGRTKKEMHWYLKAHGVRRTQKDPMPNPRVSEDA